MSVWEMMFIPAFCMALLFSFAADFTVSPGRPKPGVDAHLGIWAGVFGLWSLFSLLNLISYHQPSTELQALLLTWAVVLLGLGWKLFMKEVPPGG